MCSSIPTAGIADHCLRRRERSVYRAFNRYFPQNRYTSLAGGSGYFASWAAYVEDYDACLFEFPDVSSTRDFENKGYGEDYVNAICWMLEHYN